MPRDLETIRQLWQKEPECYVRKALARDIHAYPPEVQSLIIEVAKERGILGTDEEYNIPPVPDEHSWTDQSPVISSSFTFFDKYVFSTAWICGFGAGAIEALLYNVVEGLGFLGAWFMGTMLIYELAIKLKRVEMREGSIIVSNYFTRIAIPTTEIAKVSESRFLSTHPVYITFKHKTRFGQTIMFMPKFALGSMFFLSHPVVKTLRSLITAE
ncbi:MAG: hypothetical protein IH624_16945 [Phycisphaerae bacterium]|nr:hypothetical protein [Phycisphaerae bacterium]